MKSEINANSRSTMAFSEDKANSKTAIVIRTQALFRLKRQFWWKAVIVLLANSTKCVLQVHR